MFNGSKRIVLSSQEVKAALSNAAKDSAIDKAIFKLEVLLTEKKRGVVVYI